MDFTMNETKQAVGGYRSMDRWIDGSMERSVDIDIDGSIDRSMGGYFFWVIEIEITWDFGHAPMDARRRRSPTTTRVHTRV